MSRRHNQEVQDQLLASWKRCGISLEDLTKSLDLSRETIDLLAEKLDAYGQ